jgi:hypothetical protein
MQNFKSLILLLLLIVIATVPAGARADDVLLSDAEPSNPVLIVQAEIPAVSSEQPPQIPVPQGQNGDESIPMGQTGDETRSEDDDIGAEIFGRQGGRLHPYYKFSGFAHRQCVCHE